MIKRRNLDMNYITAGYLNEKLNSNIATAKNSNVTPQFYLVQNLRNSSVSPNKSLFETETVHIPTAENFSSNRSVEASRPKLVLKDTSIQAESKTFIDVNYPSPKLKPNYINHTAGAQIPKSIF
jgi:hypothetical protein